MPRVEFWKTHTWTTPSCRGWALSCVSQGADTPEDSHALITHLGSAHPTVWPPTTHKKTTELRRWGFFVVLEVTVPFFQIIQLARLSGSYLQQQFYIYRHRAIIDYIKISFDLWKPQIFHLLLYICAAYFTFERRTKEALLCFYRHLRHILSQKRDSVFADWKQGTLDMNAMSRMQTMNQRTCLRNPDKVSIT